MATGRPPIDPFSPIVQKLVENFEQEFFPDGGLEENANNAGREFNDDFKRAYVCALMADVKSGRWEMGTTQDEISESLGILSDRSWVSHAINDGWMDLDIYMRLRCWPLRPKDWEPVLDHGLLPDMQRSGFIAAARSYAMWVKNRPRLAPQRLDALNYELICEIFGTLNTWASAFVSGNEAAAAELVRSVCRDARRNVNPIWYKADRRRGIEAEIKRLTGTGTERAAFEHLAWLQSDWLDVFAATDAVLEREYKRKAK